ncbi:ATP-binding protein [Symbioplanes lichenis]|uniref:ATP-binding protein n=1 Tax=Symbioplanes lichenis TaxID=1629072 RepID=UPI002739D431|nr:ATP-binding protein [Actinoplanes lichenis]
MEDSVGQNVLRPAPGRESPDVDASWRQTGDGPLLDRVFGQDDITVLRHEVLDRLGRLALGDRRDGFVLAVNEVITNVVLHGGGGGRLVLALTAGDLWCTITDSGPGIPEEFQRPPEVPEAFDVGGRGIWLAYQLCDEVTMATGPIGTTIGLKIGLMTSHTASDLVNGPSATA